jgi:hypothetical protein
MKQTAFSGGIFAEKSQVVSSMKTIDGELIVD